ncbi:hypothetical protein CMK11_19340 [Candidatus Poribacteria bacterium]|nr:hypothetical protein [Candidatus Poribacteria bacterium]
MSDSANASPLPIPPDFDPQTNMLARHEDSGTFHASRLAAEFAAKLIDNGTEADIELASKVLIATLECQERDERDPHYGNFRWEREDEVVEDLNAVQFVLFPLIPVMIRHADCLPSGIGERVLSGIRRGLEAIQRIDVHPSYTNIAVKSACNACLGGQLLGDATISDWGQRKLADWIAFTNRSGHPHEYNSPVYTAVAIRVLAVLRDHSENRDTHIRATTMLARLGLSVALHIHPGTGRWAGPHGRMYYPAMIDGASRELQQFMHWTEDGTLPEWLVHAMRSRPEPMQVVETWNADDGGGASTYHGRSFSLGVASKELSNQANRFIDRQCNVFTLHYSVEHSQSSGVVYSRYILNDEWLGDYRSTPSRSSSALLPDDGYFYGAHDGDRAIGIYAPRDLGALSRCSSAKAVVVWNRRESVDEIVVDGEVVNRLPADIPDGSTVVVACGDVYVAIRPLPRADLGRDAPCRLVEIDGDLALELYNYLGPSKTFWELATPGAFYRGMPRCGFYVEVAERSAHPSTKSFGAVVSRGDLVTTSDEPFTDDGFRERRWTVEYTRESRTLGIDVDLMRWRLARRWNQVGDLGHPMLEAPIAQQNASGEITIGDACVKCGSESAWLYANPERRVWVAAFQGQRPGSFTMDLPVGRVEIERMGVGMVVWNEGLVTVAATDLLRPPSVIGGQLQRLIT